MFEIKEYNSNIDLTDFFKECEKRGFTNNNSKKSLINCFENEKYKKIWILFFKNKPVGSVAAHSFDSVMGANSYRIAARTCVLTNLIEGHQYSKNLRTKNVICHHQNPTSQFLLPVCLSWVPQDSSLYITTNEELAGTQSRVNKIFAPIMQEKKIIEKVKTIYYRNTWQNLWKFNRDTFFKDLDQYRRWN